MQRRILLKLAPSLALAGCATDSMRSTLGGIWPLEKVDHLPAAQTGWLVGSIGARWSRAALRFSVAFSPAGQLNRRGELAWSNSGLFGNATDAEVEGAKLSVQTMRLFPGRYEVTGLDTHPWVTPDPARQRLSAHFDIEAGRVTYLGELVAWLTTEGALPFGLSAPRGYVATLRDQSARDVDLLRRKGVVLPDVEPLKSSLLTGPAPVPALLRIS